ncbi:hypothetical protein CACET_c22920 [Clostridium aceticum]|uniref:Uncharacterized protein n=1 Tax=Clostridium aceticum TaxID=84022 RepID=A0A0D8I8W6_9CLOT|nr:hypothetical protein [Clostridium aceticum]AKL95738.1 hypothetical protein CACET_c22920 [Clostridium aceticum]KJF26713.1 hypothetical protein TZ02_10805 [Clostridium aceticum]
MGLIYSLFKWVLGFNMLIIFLVICELQKMIKSYIKQKKYGGNKIEAFYHKSKMKTLVAILFAIGTMFNFWMLESAAIGDAVLFQLYLLIIVIEGWKKIIVYEKGIYHMGRFVKWEEIKSIKTHENSIRIEIKGSLLGMLMMNKVSRARELIQLIEENI